MNQQVTLERKMVEVHEFTKESQARSFWHHLCAQMGLERASKEVKISFVNGVHKFAINRVA